MRYKVFHPQPCKTIPYEEKKLQYVPVHAGFFGGFKRVVHKRIGLWADFKTGSIIFSLWEITDDKI